MKHRVALTLALAAAVGAVAPARALPSPVVVATYFQFVPGQTGGPVEVLEGSPLLLTHQDVFATQIFNPWHDLTSYALDEDGEPLFASPVIAFGETAPIAGVESLAPGTYGFYCNSHGETLMRGELIVHPSPV